MQDCAAFQWGQSVSRTSRGSKRIDHMWISPELQFQLLGVEVQFDHWADHAAVVAKFRNWGTGMVSDEWYMPAAFAWPAEWTCQVQWDASQDTTVAYAHLWSQLETQASSWQALHGVRIRPLQCGRAQTLESKKQVHRLAPCRKGRVGEVQPSFMGVSLQHARYFKQLRRLQALKQQLSCEAASWNANENRHATWRAIRNAVGFPEGFGIWWHKHDLSPVLPEVLPVLCPSAEVVQKMFEIFQKFVGTYEGQLAQTRYRLAKQRRAENLNYVFQDCKAEPLPQADTLLDQVEVGIEEVREEDSSIVLVSPVQLLPDVPVVAGGKVLEVVHAEHDQLWVEDVTGVGPGMFVSQQRAIMDDQAILARFRDTWKPRWNKMSHVADGQWEQIFAFARRHFQPIQWVVAPWTTERFAAAVKRKKPKAAKGPDGVSQLDLVALPAQSHSAFVALFQAMEAGQPWPQQLATGFVTSLAKVETAQQVDSFRPVTVYSLLYRIWSSERAREALQNITRVVPSSVQGGVPGRQAKVIWYTEAQALELAHLHDSELNGLQMDIQKCFNAIPRMPPWCVLHQLGFPEHVLRAWVGFVSGQARRFRIRRSTGEAIFSLCGLPEGCALSVFGMVVIDWLLDVWLQQLTPSPSLQAFIDDWSVMFGDFRELGQVWESVLEFTRCLDLTLDLRKTKLWSTAAAARKQFREGELEVAYIARVLGAHQNYTKHSWNSILQKRLQTLPDVWTKLRASLAPYKAKHLAVRLMGWPRAFHACSVVHVGGGHYKKVRSGAMRGLRVERKGANPCLHLILSNLQGDPEAWVITQTFRDARELGGLERVEGFLALFSSDPSGLPANGPTAILADRVARLGWKVGGNGLVQDGLGTFSLLHTGWDEVYLRMSLGWGTVLQAAVGHRSSFEGIDQMDLFELHRALRKFGDLDLAFLRCHLDGTLYTQNGRAKFQAGVDDTCPWCQQKDGFYHRTWTCAHFADCRTHLSEDQRAIIPSLPACLSLHGWPVVLPEWKCLSQFLLSPTFVCQESPVHPAVSGGIIDLFVDGTAAWPREPKLRYAAWAVTCATGGPGTLPHQLVLGGHVSGLIQSAFRAELTAVVEAVRWALGRNLQVRLWSDCLAVV